MSGHVTSPMSAEAVDRLTEDFPAEEKVVVRPHLRSRQYCSNAVKGQMQVFLYLGVPVLIKLCCQVSN